MTGPYCTGHLSYQMAIRNKCIGRQVDTCRNFTNGKRKFSHSVSYTTHTKTETQKRACQCWKTDQIAPKDYIALHNTAFAVSRYEVITHWLNNFDGCLS